jgi:hypothetical protein
MKEIKQNNNVLGSLNRGAIKIKMSRILKTKSNKRNKKGILPFH